MSIWQTKQWWEMLKISNQASEVFNVRWYYIEKRKVSLWEYWLFILWVEKPLSEKNIKELIKLCKKEKCLFIQFETINYEKKWFLPFINNENKFIKGYYKKFITPYTAIIDLSQSEDKILARMKPKGRYNIKLAWKKRVNVIDVEKKDKNIEQFYNLLKQTTSRDKFSWNSIEYYKTFLCKIANSKLLLAYVDDVVVAGWIFTFEKDDISIYYYWASTSDKNYRNLMAPYLLQWEAIKIAKKMWSKIYDFLWVALPNELNSPLSWVTDFKKKLTDDVREVSNWYIWINKNIKYSIITFLKKMR